ncbi:hypothetical protein BVG79_01105 [Ketogulonicigenium robustum]|uniref:Uncharacterized protein n=1 Tax=Ketogulonicigenium robustum TaxID=92947 RepID=A0A1W6NZ53_9RHOB|nr:hypothetical protein [Ketogulonicigenium robustum]ARO14451.1 hypothetical protein BVG79_01105 [Ketogulonicigenium robustum]
MIAPVARIILRYVAAALVTYGVVAADMGRQIANDPDILNALTILIGAVVGVVTEAAYLLAKRLGWTT